MLNYKVFKNQGENSAFGGGLRAPGGFRGPRFQKFKKPRIENDGPNTHPKFQHSSSIFRGPPPPPLKPPRGVSGGPDFKKSENPAYNTVVQTHTQNFRTLPQLESLQKSGELICGNVTIKGPRGFQGTPISKIQKTPHTERWS